MGQLFQELKRRNLFRVGIAYAVLSWFILQVGAIVAPALELPEWTLPFVIFILAIGFPFILIFAWAFELTPAGLKKTSEVGVDDSLTANTGRKLNHVIIAVLSLAVVALLVERFFVSGDRALEVADVQTEEPSTPGVNRKDSYESIAVLPFVKMSDDAQQEYFSDGISEELLNLLAKNKNLRLAARTSSFAFKGQSQDIKQIGHELDVDTILEGSVRKSGAKLRITAQLIETDTGYHLWSDTYDRELRDVFAIQDEISRAIVGALQFHLSGEVQTVTGPLKVTNLDAYNAYLKGRHNLEKREKEPLYQTLADFDEAITFDPTYAPAYAGKADAYMLLSVRNYGDIPEPQSNKLAEPVIAKALELDPLLADAHASNGLFADESRQSRNIHQLSRPGH